MTLAADPPLMHPSLEQVNMGCCKESGTSVDPKSVDPK